MGKHLYESTYVGILFFEICRPTDLLLYSEAGMAAGYMRSLPSSLRCCNGETLA